jgi:hypothetical protein
VQIPREHGGEFIVLLMLSVLGIGLHWISSLWIHSHIMASCLAIPPCLGSALRVIRLLVLEKGDRLCCGSYVRQVVVRGSVRRRVRNGPSVLPREK